MNLPIDLPPELIAYVGLITARFPAIQSIWLFGSRANGTAETLSDWDLLVFGSADVLNGLRCSTELHCSDIDVFVVYDGNRFASPWDDVAGAKNGRLWSGPEGDRHVYGYGWRAISKSSATYCSTRDRSIQRAYCIHETERSGQDT